MVEEGLDEIGPAVLEVEIIGMLPDIAGQERRLALRERVDRGRRLRDLERAALEDEPSPAAAELRRGGLLELLLEFVEAAEGLLDAFGEIARRLSAAARLHAVPEEGVIPHLRRIVEDACLGVILCRGANDLLERLARHRRVLHQVVEIGHISLVMLAVMKLERARRHMRLKAVLGIGKRREFESHGDLTMLR